MSQSTPASARDRLAAARRDLRPALAALAAVSATERDVRLPGEPLGDPRMGSLALVQGDGVVDVTAWDYGESRVLMRARDLDEAVAAVVDRLQPGPVQARGVTQVEWTQWCAETAHSVAGIDDELGPGRVVETSLRPGSVVDRFGNLDGFCCTPAAARWLRGLCRRASSTPPGGTKGSPLSV